MACAEETEKTDRRIHSFLAAGTSQKKQLCVEGWAGQERVGEVQIVCTFAEQGVEDGGQVLAINWQRFQQQEEEEEEAMGRGGSKKVSFDCVK